MQYREVQGFESERFLSYFPHFVCLKGGVATGFHHVTDPPPLDIHRLYRITLTRTSLRPSLAVREVPAEASSLVAGDVYVLDKGASVLQFNTKASAGQEKFKAAEFVQTLIQTRKGQCSLTVYGMFLTKSFVASHSSQMKEDMEQASSWLSSEKEPASDLNLSNRSRLVPPSSVCLTRVALLHLTKSSPRGTPRCRRLMRFYYMTTLALSFTSGSAKTHP